MPPKEAPRLSLRTGRKRTEERAPRRSSKPVGHPTASRVVRVCTILEATYGSPRHGNPTDPFDDLIYILLSNRTAPNVSKHVYDQLMARFPSREALREATEAELGAVLAPAGLANKRTAKIRGIIARLDADFGTLSLEPIRSWQEDRAEAYLTSLPGVSLKVAKCVLLYGMNRQVLPVDVHVHRVARRLGWISHKRADQSHETLEKLVPPDLRYGFHVNALAHGRAVCRPVLPRCGECTVRSLCDYYRAGGPALKET